jgi:hypothetical protein
VNSTLLHYRSKALREKRVLNAIIHHESHVITSAKILFIYCFSPLYRPPSS